MTGYLPFPDPPAKNPPATKNSASDNAPPSPADDLGPGRLFLLDGNALAYRGHFALIRQPLTTSSGQNVSALYVFANTLMRILEVEKPDYIAVAFDPKGPTFRHERFHEYKATRDKTPSELIAMMPLIRELVEGFGAPILCVPGFEADDIIGTVACQAAAAGHEVFIVTGDKDFLQIVSPKIKLYNVLRQNSDVEIQGVEAAAAKFGVPPERVVDVLALMGDSSDNVPGVAGVGPKSATDLVQRLGSVEEIYERLDEVGKPALRAKLEASRDAAFLSKELVTLDLNAPATFDASSFRCTPPDTERLIPLLREYEMASLVKRLAATPKNDRRKYQTVDTADLFDDLIAAMEAADAFSFDVQHDGRSPREGHLLGISIALQPNEASWVPLARAARRDNADRLARLKPLLEDPEKAKYVHDAKDQALWLGAAGIALRGVRFDTMLGSYCASPSEFQHDLSAIALRCLSVSRTPDSQVFGSGKSRVALDQAEPGAARDYACEAADLVARLTPVLQEELRTLSVESLFLEVELPLARVLQVMEETGVKVDVEFLAAMSRELDGRIDALTVQIHEQAGTAFNINSPKQLGPVLFEKLEIHKQLGHKKAPKRTKTGYSTDASVLLTMVEHPIVAAVLEFRGLTKLKGTYVDALPLLADKHGRVHTHFNQAVAATGRLSSSDPNLQNIPNRTEEGRRIRRAFVAGEPGWSLLAADYSQVELRIMAHLSADPNMRRAFSEGQDIHRWTAGLIFGMTPEEVTPELRFRAKAINFGVIYGMGPQRLAQETGMTVKEATTFIDAYFRTFAGVKAWLDRTLELATEQGFVTTLLGRRRQLQDLESSHPRIAAQARNMAVNTPIQGTAADLIKVAMIRIDERLRADSLQSRMLLQVHDELLFECPADEIAPLTKMVRETMASALTLDVPLVIDVGVGDNWLEAH